MCIILYIYNAKQHSAENWSFSYWSASHNVKPSTDFTVFNFYDIFKNVFLLLNIVQFEYVSHNFELIWTFYSF